MNLFSRRKSRNRSIKGIGIGLSIAKAMIALHNGEVKVESKQNQGTLFKIKIHSIIESIFFMFLIAKIHATRIRAIKTSYKRNTCAKVEKPNRIA